MLAQKSTSISVGADFLCLLSSDNSDTNPRNSKCRTHCVRLAPTATWRGECWCPTAGSSEPADSSPSAPKSKTTLPYLRQTIATQVGCSETTVGRVIRKRWPSKLKCAPCALNPMNACILIQDVVARIP